jgi:hypothetical protein
MRAALLSLALSAAVVAHSTVSPENARLYRDGDPVTLTLDSLQSTRVLASMEAYRIPFCVPVDHHLSPTTTTTTTTLGERLAGHHIEASAFEIRMKKDVSCQKASS